MNIEKTEKGYTIKNATGDSILLSEAELADMALNARHILGLSQSDDRSQSQYRPVATEPLEDLTVGIDAHHTAISLTFQLRGGREIGTTVEVAGATQLRDMLTRKIELIQSNPKPVQ